MTSTDFPGHFFCFNITSEHWIFWCNHLNVYYGCSGWTTQDLLTENVFARVPTVMIPVLALFLKNGVLGHVLFIGMVNGNVVVPVDVTASLLQQRLYLKMANP